MEDAELVERFPWVVISHDSKHLFRGWLDRRLLIQRCDDCGKRHHPPKPICPGCWSSALTPEEVSGRGTIFLTMMLHQGAPAPGVDYSLGPHPIVTVALEEDPSVRFTSTIIDCPIDEIAIGMSVELDWIERFDAPFPVFRRSTTETPASRGSAMSLKEERP